MSHVQLRVCEGWHKLFWRMFHSQSSFVEFVRYSGHCFFPFHSRSVVGLQEREMDDSCSRSGGSNISQISETLLLCSAYAVEWVR